jgi:hypothetical protein
MLIDLGGLRHKTSRRFGTSGRFSWAAGPRSLLASPGKNKKRAIPRKDSPFAATLYGFYCLALQRRVA